MALKNTGLQPAKILEAFFNDDDGLQGMIMPNILLISPDAIVPDGTTITFNTNTNPTPTGGSNGDIWYNQPGDALYKKVGSVWSLLTNKVFNVWYQAPVENLTECPI